MEQHAHEDLGVNVFCTSRLENANLLEDTLSHNLVAATGTCVPPASGHETTQSVAQDSIRH